MIAAIILAAGSGRRFGGGKLLADLDGRPLIEHSIAAYAAVPAVERVFLVLGSGAAELRAAANLDPAVVVPCSGWQEGRSASVRCGIAAAAASGCRATLIGLGDQPLVTRGAIEAVLAHSDGTAPAARATYGGVPGHPVLVKRELFDQLAGPVREGGARRVIEDVGVTHVEVGRLGGNEDVDTKADLEAIRALLTEGREMEVEV